MFDPPIRPTANARAVLMLAAAASCLCSGIKPAAGVDGGSALADAAAAQEMIRAGKLIDAGVDLNGSQADGMTALHWSVYHDHVELVNRLVLAGAKVSIENRYGVRPLSIACQNGNTEIVESLLDHGADPNATLRGGETVLMTAARTGVLGPVQALIQRGAKLDAYDRSGQTAMMWAAAAGNTEVVDALIKAGAEFQVQLDSGFTPLLFAVREGHSDTVMKLLAAGVDVNQAVHPKKFSSRGLRRGTSPLILAIENGHFDLCRTLLDHGADANESRCGYTALHAITWVRKPIRGDGDPPPIGSGKLSSLEVVRTLAAHGADVNARHAKRGSGNERLNRTGTTPFLLAAETADVPLMRLLLELGADPTIPNADNCTPLLAAAGVGVLGDGDEAAATEAEVIEAIELLIDLGADINAVDDHGKTAMHGAAFKSWPKVVRLLARRGAEINVWNQKNRSGWTPLMIAQGHRPGNFRPSAETTAAIEAAMRSVGVEPAVRAQPNGSGDVDPNR